MGKTLKIRLDETNYPLIWVDPIQAYIHVLPITKIQFERYLSDPNAILDVSFYDDLLKINDRLTPNQLTRKNLWQLFLTGVRPNEIESFTRWMGNNYALPSQDEWKNAKKYLDSFMADQIVDAIQRKQRLNSLAKLTINKIMTILKPTYATEMTFMSGGLLEFIRVDDNVDNWLVIGNPNQDLHQTTRDYVEYPQQPISLEKRSKIFGFRLIYRI